MPTHRAAISAHRGGSEDAPSASLEAYAAAVATGAEYVEFDVRRTRDGELVAYHDDRVGRRPVGGLSYDELCEGAGRTVPRVGDVMRLIAGRAVGHLDLKEVGDEEEAVAMALDVLGPGNFVATTLEDVSVFRLKKSFPEVTAALSLGRSLHDLNRLMRLPARLRELYPLRRMRACGADWIAVHRQLARANVLRLSGRLGIPAMVWTVNSDRLIHHFLADQRVNVLVTDRPRRAVRLRDESLPCA